MPPVTYGDTGYPSCPLMDYRKLGKRGSGIRTAYRNLSFPLQEDTARHHIRQFPVRAKETEIRVPPGFQPALRYQETVSHIARKERQRAADTYLVRKNLPGSEIIPDVAPPYRRFP